MTEELMSTTDGKMSENVDLSVTTAINGVAHDVAGDDTFVDPIPEIAEKKDHNFDATKFYLNQLSQSTLLTAEQEKLYGTLVGQGDQKARQIMIESNLRLVVKIARRY